MPRNSNLELLARPQSQFDLWGARVAKKTTSHDDVNLKSRSMRIPQLAAPIAASGSNAPRSLPEYAGKSPAFAAASLQEFLAKGQRTIALSGAGISVDSNIPDYRGRARGLFIAWQDMLTMYLLGPSGTYTLNNSYRPIFFHEFVTRDRARRRYWYQESRIVL